MALCTGLLAGALHLYLQLWREGQWTTSVDEAFAITLLVLLVAFFFGDKLA